jgi:hypothetical protein
VSARAAINVLDVVALLLNMPEHGLVRGQVGTVVERLDDDVFEVEFSDDEGRTYAELALNADAHALIADRIASHIDPQARRSDNCGCRPARQRENGLN